jgi:hypothetical protein
VFCAALLLLRKTGAPPSGRLNLTPEKKVLGSCRKVMIKYAIMKTKRKTESQKRAPGTEKDLSALYGSGKGLLQDQDAQEYVAGCRKD